MLEAEAPDRRCVYDTAEIQGVLDRFRTTCVCCRTGEQIRAAAAYLYP
jgi:hypothetical protein